MNTELARRETITTLVGCYKLAEEEIKQAYALLESAKKRLDAAFISGTGYYFSINTGHRSPGIGKEAAESTLKEIKKDAWRCIVERLEIRRILSIKRREELDRQLNGETRYSSDEVKPLPDVTEENILAMFQEGMSKATDYAREAVHEVFDWLRPMNGRNAALKTNDKWMIGKKVIIWAVEIVSWGGGAFRVNYHREKEITALDNVFHMLDGRGPLKTYHGPLHDAIKASPDGTGETDFFKFRCCRNGNLHLEFKRPDLVAKINQMAGGGHLRTAA